MIQIKNRTLIIGLLIAFGVTFLGGFILGRRDRNHTSDTIINGLNDVMRTYIYRIDGLQKEVAEKNSIIVTQKQALKEGLIIKEELRKLKIKHLNEVTHLDTEVRILLDSIAYIQSNPPTNNPCPPEEIDHPVLYLPLAFKEQNSYLDLKGEFNEDGKLSMDIKIPLSVDVWTGYDKKTKMYKAVLTYDNPYLKTIDINSVKMEWTKVSRFGVALIGGYGFGWGNKKPTPVLGVGIAYNLIRF